MTHLVKSACARPLTAGFQARSCVLPLATFVLLALHWAAGGAWGASISSVSIVSAALSTSVAYCLYRLGKVLLQRPSRYLPIAPTLVALSIIAVPSDDGYAQSTGLEAKLAASRTSGTAPLAVMFDATRTTAPAKMDAFSEINYTFDFGDDRKLTWPHSGQPRNTQSGAPLAAHVFDVPGTFTVRVRAQTKEGAASEATVTIKVEDPDVVFSGERTICVSPTRQYAGCPAKAVRETRLPASLATKRVLLNRGESFGPLSINRNSDTILIGSYGTGHKPIVQQVLINAGQFNGKFVDDLVIMDLAITEGINQYGTGSRHLYYRNDLTTAGGNNSIVIGHALDYLAQRNPKARMQNPREIFVVDNVIRGQVNSAQRPFNNIEGQGAFIAIMGNDVSRAEQHSMRLFAVHKGVVAHNALRGHSLGTGPNGTGASIRSTMKIHSGGLQPYADDWSANASRWATSQLVIADNQFGDRENNTSFTAGVAPQDREPGTTEGIEDVVIERNRFIRGPYTNTEMENLGRRITTRKNTRIDGGAPHLSTGRPSPSLPAEWHGPYFRQ